MYSLISPLGTDMHHPSSGVYGWTTLLSNFTEEAIFEALKNKQTSIIYSAIPSPYSAGFYLCSRSLNVC